jgi:hypothetical protein
MKILFFSNTLTYRGTSTAIWDYAVANQELLGNESVIGYDCQHPYEKDKGTEPDVLKRFQASFEVRPMSLSNLDRDTTDIDLIYFLRSGAIEPTPMNCKSAIHAVFQYKQPYGDRFAYISEWLSRELSNHKIPFVPHIVNLPKPNLDLRRQLGIPPQKKIIGRIGGYDTFDIDFVKEQIKYIAQNDSGIVFLLANTRPFVIHDNIIYVDSINDLQVKSNFISTCDMMLHARQSGETFGLALCESLFLNVPVISYEGGIDRHHIDLLKNTNMLYSETTFLDVFYSCLETSPICKQLVNKFSPAEVMKKFKTVFID